MKLELFPYKHGDVQSGNWSWAVGAKSPRDYHTHPLNVAVINFHGANAAGYDCEEIAKQFAASSNANIETAMCLWEAVMDGLAGNNSLVQRLIDEAGTVAARHVVASWIPECEAEWEKVKDDFDQPFDWEFCPAFVQRKLEERYA